MNTYDNLDAWIDAHFDEEVRFLQALVRVPTDTPPGNNAPHAERTAELLNGFGIEVEKHPVPADEVRAYGARKQADGDRYEYVVSRGAERMTRARLDWLREAARSLGPSPGGPSP